MGLKESTESKLSWKDFINFRVGRISCQYEWEKILKIMDEENLQAEVLYRTKEEESIIQTDSVPEVAVSKVVISEVMSKITMPEVAIPEVEQTDRSPFFITIDKFIEDTVKEIGTTKEAIKIKETADSIDQGFKMVKRLFQNSIKVIVGQVGEHGFGQTVDQNQDQDVQQAPRRNLKRNADQLDEENVEEDVKQNVEQDAYEADASDNDHMEVDDIWELPSLLLIEYMSSVLVFGNRGHYVHVRSPLRDLRMA